MFHGDLMNPLDHIRARASQPWRGLGILSVVRFEQAVLQHLVRHIPVLHFAIGRTLIKGIDLLPVQLERRSHPLQLGEALAHENTPPLLILSFFQLTVCIENLTDFGDAENCAHRQAAELAQERSQRHGGSCATKLSDGISDNRTRLERIARAPKMAHCVADCRSKAVVVLWRYDHVRIGLLHSLFKVPQNFWRLARWIRKHRLPQERKVKLHGVYHLTLVATFLQTTHDVLAYPIAHAVRSRASEKDEQVEGQICRPICTCGGRGLRPAAAPMET
mmetsp:Transcript_145/g.442  ORF Transcript_145/g.442 Transcript_145/m.442 type:complete len:276 (+) Transcript_145:1071-1898(+)